jgi:hypothetical protein
MCLIPFLRNRREKISASLSIQMMHGKILPVVQSDKKLSFYGFMGQAVQNKKADLPTFL